jgi:hypothetical protein
MLKTLIPIIMLSTLTLFALGGCEAQKEPEKKADAVPAEPSPAAPDAKPDPASKHASPGAKPGSHEDWCGAHQVPESLCSRCNPSLITAFKATGDWCEEHGLPESQCLICNPDTKIERPPPAGEASP